MITLPMKHIPMRMCIACRQMKPQNGLLRFVRENKTGQIMIDKDKKLFGRGAYICRDAQCLTKASKKNGLNRHFKCAVPEEVYISAAEMI